MFFMDFIKESVTEVIIYLQKYLGWAKWLPQIPSSSGFLVVVLSMCEIGVLL